MSRWHPFRVVHAAQSTPDREALATALRDMASHGSWVVMPPGVGFRIIHPDAPRDFKPRTSLGSGLVPRVATCDECSGVGGAHKPWCGT